MSTDALDNVRNRIRSGDMELALEELDEFIDSDARDLVNELSLHIANYNRLSQEYRRQVITYDMYRTNVARLSNSILAFVDEVEKKQAEQGPPVIKPAFSVELPENTTFEKLIGANNLKQIHWLRKGLDLTKSICRILTPAGKGTGFTIGNGLLMTNNHVLPSADIAEESVAEFNYELDALGNELPSYRYKLSSEYFYTSPSDELDYTIVHIVPDDELPPLEEWGALTLAPNARPYPDEHVTIVQHPEGSRKKIAITANQIVKTIDRYVYYTTDTMRGSSGSPVFDDAWEVAALHHAYGGVQEDSNGNQRHVNEGILMEVILSDAGATWQSG